MFEEKSWTIVLYNVYTYILYNMYILYNLYYTMHIFYTMHIQCMYKDRFAIILIDNSAGIRVSKEYIGIVVFCIRDYISRFRIR